MQFDWHYTLSLFLNGDFWRAVATVVELSLETWLLGIVLGFLLALARQSQRRWLRDAACIYIWFFRSLPLLVLLIFVYNLPQVFPSTSALLSNPYSAGLIALVLSEAAYIAEIHRGGLLAVSKGQLEAGKALGVGFRGVQRLIVVPQALRHNGRLAMPCHAMPCHAMPCHAMPCRAVPCRAVRVTAARVPGAGVLCRFCLPFLEPPPP